MKRFQLVFVVLKVPVDLLMLLTAAWSAYALRFADFFVLQRPVVFNLSLPDFLFLTLAISPLWLLLFAVNGLYSSNPNRKLSQDMNRIFVSSTAAIAIIAMYLLFTQEQFDSRFLLAAGWIFSMIFVMFGRLFLRGVQALFYRFGVGLRSVILIGEGDIADIIQNELRDRKELGYRIIAHFARFDGRTKAIIQKEQIDELILMNPRSRETESLSAIAYADANHITLKYSADLFATYSSNMTVQPLAGVPVVELRRTPLEGWGRVIKRLFDIVASVFLIILFSPIMLLTAMAIKIDSRGPVFFNYRRVGLRGESFIYFKFRSMVKDAHLLRYDPSFRKEVEDLRGWTKENPVIKYKDDPRITRVGRFIRRYSIDELPEFFLVLAGSMSLVGPRPHEQEEVEKYKSEYFKVFTLKPGVTGLAQISGRSDLTFHEEMQLDLLYMERWNLFLDMIILLKTPFVLFRRRKAL